MHIDQKVVLEYGLKYGRNGGKPRIGQRNASEEIGHLAQEGDQLAAIENYQGICSGSFGKEWNALMTMNEHCFIPEEQPI